MLAEPQPLVDPREANSAKTLDGGARFERCADMAIAGMDASNAALVLH